MKRLNPDLLWIRLCFALLGLAVLGASIGLARQGLNLQTDLQALLPDHHQSNAARTAHNEWVEQAENQIIILLSHENRAEVLEAGQWVIQAAENHASVMPVNWNSEATQVQQFEQQLFHNFRRGLLSKGHRRWLETSDHEAVQKFAGQALFGLSSSNTRLASDPLSLFTAYLTDQRQLPPQLSLEDGLLVAGPSGSNDTHKALIIAELTGSPFSLETQEQLRQFIGPLEQSLADRNTSLTLAYSGVVFHASEAAQKTRSEIQLIAIGSTIGIVLLFLLTFRSLTPLLASLAALAFGCLSAFVLCHWIYGELHLLTLVFGASLIGVAIDYSLHFFAHHHPPDRGDQTLRRILPSIALGLGTTLLGYLYLTQASLPGLRQIASFCLIGLVSTWLFVGCWYPLLNEGKADRAPRWILALYQLPDKLWGGLKPNSAPWVLLAIVLITLVVIATLARPSDDIRTLYRPGSERVAADNTIQSELQGVAPNQYFLVSGEQAQAVLENTERLTVALDQVVAAGGLEDYLAITRSLPSISAQETNLALQKSLFATDGESVAWLRQIGFDDTTLTTIQARYREPFAPLTLDDWLAIAPPTQQALWLGNIDGRYHTVVRLRGVSALETLQSLADSAQEVVWVDQVASISAHLEEQRQTALSALGIAYLLIAGLLWFRYRRPGAMLKIAIPAVASLTCLAVLSVAGVAISLFHIFGLFLVLGLGMDYGIFLADSHSSKERNHSLLAVGLSATTSILSFGLLSFSSAPMIQAFGLIVLLGSLINLIAAPSLTANTR